MATDFNNLGNCIRSKLAVLSNRDSYIKNKKQKRGDDTADNKLVTGVANMGLSDGEGEIISTVAKLYSTFDAATDDFEVCKI